MEHRNGLAVGRVQHWRPAMVPAVATGLLLLERVLLDQMGSPVTLLRALGDLGQPWTDPVASVLAVMALTAETLVGHVLVVLVLGSMGTLPGSMGRLAARLTSLITPVAARRLLDLLRAARCSPRRPWPCHQVHRMSIGGPPHTRGRPRPRPSALSKLFGVCCLHHRPSPASLILTRSGLWTAPRWPLAAPR
jgi:hypothetical protein